MFKRIICLFKGHELGKPYMADDGLVCMDCIRCKLKTGMGRVMKYNPPSDFGFKLEPDELGYYPIEDVHSMGRDGKHIQKFELEKHTSLKFSDAFKHGVELSDDVIIMDGNGKRIPNKPAIVERISRKDNNE